MAVAVAVAVAVAGVLAYVRLLSRDCDAQHQWHH